MQLSINLLKKQHQTASDEHILENDLTLFRPSDPYASSLIRVVSKRISQLKEYDAWEEEETEYKHVYPMEGDGWALLHAFGIEILNQVMPFLFYYLLLQFVILSSLPFVKNEVNSRVLCQTYDAPQKETLFKRYCRKFKTRNAY